MNEIFLVGNVVDDISTTNDNNVASCRFNLSVARNYKDANNHDIFDIIPILAVNNNAQLCIEQLQPDSQIAIHGHFSNEKQDQLHIFEIVTQNIQILN